MNAKLFIVISAAGDEAFEQVYGLPYVHALQHLDTASRSSAYDISQLCITQALYAFWQQNSAESINICKS